MKKLFTVIMVMFSFITTYAIDYYWIGDGGNWSDVNHWSNSSGGSPNQEIPPTQNDNVYFDAYSFSSTGQTVTMDVDASCYYFDMSSVTNNPTIYMPSWDTSFYIYSSATFSGNATYNLKYVYLMDGGFASYITSNGAYLGNSSDLVVWAGNWLLADSLSTVNLEFYGNYFGLNGQSLSSRDLFYISGNATDAVDMSSSRLYTGYLVYSGSASLGTGESTIYMTGSNNTFNGAGQYYGDLVVGGNTVINGNNSFSTLKLLPASTLALQYGSQQSVNALIANGVKNSEINLMTDQAGSYAIIYSMSSVLLDYVVVKDIYAYGMIPFQATNSINVSGNANWSFTPPASGDYYWVGNGGNWSDLSHWASSSGASADKTEPPSKYDDVFFDNNSFATTGQTVTIDDTVYCRNLDLTTVTNNPTLYSNSSDNSLNIQGSFLMGSNATFNLRLVYFSSSSTGNVITSNGNNPGPDAQFYFYGAGKWTLTDSMSVPTIAFYQGVLDLNGQAVNMGINGNIYLNGSPMDTIDMTDATIYTRYFQNYSNIYLMTEGSVIHMINLTSSFFSGYGQTYNKLVIHGYVSFEWYSNTFDTIEIYPGAEVVLPPDYTQTVNFLDAIGSKFSLINIHSSSSGNQAEIYSDYPANVEWAVIKDIYAWGDGMPFDAYNSTDNGNNTGWNFYAPTGTDYYWVGGTGNWKNPSEWSSTSNGTPDKTERPSMFDNVHFDEYSFSASGQIVTIDTVLSCKSLDMSEVTNSPTLYIDPNNGRLNVDGSFILSPDASYDLNEVYFTSSQAGNIISTWGKYLGENSELYFQGTGSWSLADSLSVPALFFYSGYLDLNQQPVYPGENGSFYIYGNPGDTLDMSGSHIYLSNFVNRSGGTVITDGSTIHLLVDNYFDGNGIVYNEVVVDKYLYMELDNNTFNIFRILPGAEVRFPYSRTQTIGTLIADGTKTNEIYLHTGSDGLQATLQQTSGPVTVQWVRLKDIIASGVIPFTANNSTDLGGNVDWTINAPVASRYYWIGGSGTWSDLSHWSTTSGGIADQLYLPGRIDSVFFDANSYSADGTLTIDMDLILGNLDMSAMDDVVEMTNPDNYSLTLYGSLALPENIIWDIDHNYFYSEAPGNIIGNGYNLANNNLYFYGSGEYILTDSISVNWFGMYKGTIDFNDQPVTAAYIQIDGSQPMDVYLRSSDILVYARWYMSATDINIDPGTSTITIDGGEFYADVNGLGTITYNDVVFSSSWGYLYNTATFNNITVAPSIDYMYFQGGATFTVNDLQATGTSSNRVELYAYNSPSQYTFSKSTGTVNISYASLRDAVATGGATFNAIESTDNGNNSGWNFIADVTPPEFIGGYPFFSDTTESAFTLHFELNEGGVLYFVLMSDSSESPNVSEVVNGTGAGGATPVQYGSVNITQANTEITKVFSSLSTGTNYDLFLVAKDGAGTPNLQTNVTFLNVKTSGNMPPVFKPGYPVITTIYESRADFTVMVNEPSFVYFGILPAGSPAPTPAQLKAGPSAGFQPVDWSWYDHNNPLTNYNYSVSGLTGDTDYDLYFVAEDKATPRNLQDSVTLLSFATAPYMPPVFTPGYPYIGPVQDNLFILYLAIDEPSDVYYVLVPDGAAAPSVNQVLNGLNASGAPALLAGMLDYNNYGGSNNYAIYGVEKETNYDVYLVAQDIQSVPNVQATVTRLDLSTTSDTYAPEYYHQPEIANVFNQSVDIVTSLTEPGSVYFIVDTAGSSNPTPAQVFAGTTSTGGVPVTSGSILVADAFTQVIATIEGLAPQKTYYMFLSAQDDEAVPNRMNWVMTLSFSTNRESRNYYWVGNAGYWSDTIHWVGTSGGTDYYSEPPTSMDNVFFDDNSFTLQDQQVTVNQTAYFNDMTWTDSPFKPVFYSDYQLNAYGSVIIPKNIKLKAYRLDLHASDADNVLAIDFSGTDNDWMYYLYGYAYGAYTITDSALYNGIYSYGGDLTFDAPASIGELRFYSPTNPRALTLNNVDLQVNNFGNYTENSAKVVANNSRMIITSSFEVGQNEEYSTIVFDGDVYTGGSPIIDTLILVPGTTVYLHKDGTLTVNELIAQGTKTELIEIKSSTTGQQSRIKKTSGTFNGEYLKISDNIAMGGATFNATNSFDMGNNSGWNFTTPVFKDYYWVGGSGVWSDLSHWSSTSGGTPDQTNLPFEFENVYFDQNSFNGPGTVSLDMDMRAKTLDASALDEVVTFTQAPGPAVTAYVNGSMLLPDKEFNWNINYLYFLSDSAGNTIQNGYNLGSANVYFNGNGEYILLDSTSMNQSHLSSGTLDLNDQPFRAQYFNVETSNPQTLKMGSSRIYIDWYWYVSATNLTLDAGTSTIVFKGGYFYADQNNIGLAYNDIIFDHNYVYLYYPASFNTITITSGTALYVQGGRTVNFNDLFAAGTKALNVYLLSDATGNQFTFNKSTGTVNVFNAIIQDSKATGGAVFNAYESTDNGNNSGWNFLSDTIPPEFLAGYPLFRDTTETSFVLAVRVNEGGKVYYVLMPDSSEIPTVTEVVDGTGAGGAAALASGSITLTSAGDEFTKMFTNLTVDTHYDLFLVAQDDATAQNLQDTVTLLNVKTSGNQAPLFLEGYPVITWTYENKVDFSIKVNEPATVYYAVVNRGTASPTPEQVKAGSSAGFEPINYDNYNHSDPASVYPRSLYGLTPATDYDLYVVAEDKAAVPNLQDSVTLLQFTTAPNMPPVFNAGYPFINNILDSRFVLHVSMDEPGKVFYVVVPNNDSTPSVTQVMLGQQANGHAAFLSGNFNYNQYGGSDSWWVNGTEPLTSYDVYIVARDNQPVPNVQAFVTKLDLTTVTDVYPPEYQIYPEADYFYDDSIKILLQLDEAGTAYYVVDTAGAATPSVNQVFAGTTADGGTPVSGGTFDVPTGYVSILGTVTGLNPETSYRIFVVCEDDEAVPNRITYVRLVDATTTRTPRNYYWVGNGGNWSDVSHWATTSGGTEFYSEPPTAIDNVYFDENSFTLAGQTVTVSSNIYFNDMVWINDTLQPGLSSSYGLIAYGSVIVPKNIKFSVSSITLMASDTGNVLAIDFTNNNGDNLSYIYMDAFGEYTVTDSFSIYYMEFYSGSMILNSPVSMSYMRFYNTDPKALTINIPEFRINNWYRYSNTNLTLTAPNTTFYINGYFYDEDGGIYPRIDFSGTNMYTWGTFSIDTLILEPGHRYYLGSGHTITIKDLVALGTKTSMIEIRSDDAGSQATLYKASGTVNVDYVKMIDNAAIGGATFNANNSIDLGNNSGWNFTPPASLDYYWIGGSGEWSDLSHWSKTSGGPANHAELPGEFDDVYFDGSSFNATGQMADIDIGPVKIHSLDMTGSRSESNVNGWVDLYIYGSLILHDSANFSVRYVYFMSDLDGNVVKDAGAGRNYPWYYFYGTGSWTFTDSVSVYQIYQNNGSLDMNDQPVNCYNVYSVGNTPRSLDLGSSKIYTGYWEVNGSNLSLNPGTSTIYMMNGGTFWPNASGIPGLYYHDLVIGNIVNVQTAGTVNVLTLLPGSTLRLKENANFYVNELRAEGTADNRIYLQSTTAGVRGGIVQSSGTVNGYYLDINDNNASGGATFNAYFSNLTNSSGWNLIKMPQTVSFDTTTYLTYDPEGMVMSATASSGELITFELVSGDGMVSNDTLYANTPGTFTVRAFQAGNNYYQPSDTVEHMYIISKLSQFITFGNLADKDAGDAPFLISATASSGLPVSFSVSGPATISNDTIYLTGETGSVEITASQPGNAFYYAAEPVLQTFNVTSVSKTDQTITFDAIPDQVYGTASVVLSATASSGLPVEFIIVSGPATVSGNTVSLGNAGTVQVMATQAGNETYNPAPSVTRTFVVNKAAQTISFTDLAQLTYLDDPYPLEATASSGLPVTYKVNNGKAAIIYGENLIPNGSFDQVNGDGTAALWGGWGGDANTPLPQVVGGVAVCTPIVAAQVWQYQFSQTGLNALPDVDYIFMFKAWADAPRPFIVDFEDRAENNYYRYGSSRDPRTEPDYYGRSDWAFDVTTEPAWYMFDVRFDSIKGNTIQKVQFMLGTSDIVTYIDSVLLIRNFELDVQGAGVVRVSAYQAGNINYLAADSVTQVITVSKASQQVQFQAFESVLISHEPIPLTSTASSGLPLTYTVSGPASMANDSIYLSGTSGVVWVFASQAGNVDYKPVTDSTSFTVTDPGKTNQTITFNAIADQTYGTPWVVVSATATSGLAVQFAIASGPATVSNDTVYLTGAGTVMVNALQPGNGSYNPAPKVSRTFIVSLTGQTISFDVIADQSYGTPWVVVSASATSGLTVNFEIESGPATVSNDTVYLTGAGAVKVNALQPGNEYFTPAPIVSRTFTVNKASQTITFMDIPNLTYGEVPYPLEAPSSSGLAATFKVNSGNASITPGGPNLIQNGSFYQVKPDGTAASWGGSGGDANSPLPKVEGGVAVCTPVTTAVSWQYVFSQSGLNALPDVDYTFMFRAWADAARTFTVDFEDIAENNYYRYGVSTDPRSLYGRSEWVFDITTEPAWYIFDVRFDSIKENTVQKLQFMLGLDGTVTYIDDVMLLTSAELNILGAGGVTVSAYQAGNSNFIAADSVTQVLTVAKADQQIVFQTFADKLISDPPITLTSTATSGLSLAYTIKGPASLVTNTIQLTGVPGTVWVIANQAGNGNYNAVTDSASFTVTNPSLLNQTITFTTIADKSYTDKYVVVTATASSDLAVTFTITSGPATVSNDTVYFTGTGTVNVQADQPGNSSYNPAPSVWRSFIINKATQTISFTDIPDMTFGDAAWPIEATATSGLIVTFKVNSGKAQVVSNQLQLTGAGTVVISAYQAGNSNYLAADSVTQSVTVAKASQQIIWQSLPNVTISNPPITLTTSSTSGLPLTFSSSGPASVTGNVLTLSGSTGEVKVFASHAGNSDYWPVSDSKSFMVTDPSKLNQTITFAAIDDVEIGKDSLVLTATASSSLAVTYELVSGPGILSGNTITFTETGTITVTAKQAGNATYNPAPNVTRSFNVIENIPCPNPVSFEDIKICEGDTARLSVTAETGHSYYWIESGTVDTVSKTVVFEEYPVVTTDYIYKEVLDSTGCEVSDEFSVTVNATPEFTFEITTNPINPGNNTSISLTGASNYTFDPSGTVTKVATGVYNLAPTDNTTYTITGLSTEGCGTKKAVDIFVYCDQCSDQLLTALSGSFDHGCDNRNYRNSANCTWTIYPSGYVIGIMIEFYADSFDVLAGDFVKVYEGSDANGTLVGSYNNSNRPPAEIIIQGTAAFINFTSNSTGVGRGFQADYSIMTGIDNAMGSMINIYPNPNEGIFTLEMKRVIFSEAEVEIFSSLGQQIWNRKIEPVNGAVNETVDLTGMPHGLYYLRIITREAVYYKTVVIE